MISIILCTVLIISCFYFFKSKSKKYQALDKFPGPSLIEIVKYGTYRKSEIFTFVENLNKRYGDVAKLWVKPFKPTLVVANPSYVENILMSRHHISKPELIKLLAPVAGDGLFSADDNLWKKERKLFGYAFTQQAIRKSVNVYKNHFDKLENIFRKTATPEIDVYPLVDNYMIDVLFDVLMGEKLNTQDNDNITYVHDFNTVLDIVVRRATSVIYEHDLFFKFSKYYSQLAEVLDNMHTFLDKLITRKLDERKLLTGDNERSYMKQLFDNGIRQDRMQFHINTFIAGGHETTSHMVSFTLFEIAKQPNIQTRILDELLAVAGNDKNVDLTFENIQSLVYTECVIKETMRMYPAIPLIPRLINTPVTIDGTTIPAGTTIIFSVAALHKNEQYFPRPNVYDPDRFMEKVPPNVFIPFSAGPRNCIGDRIAMSVMKYTVAKLVRNFELLPVPGAKLNLVNRTVVNHSTTGAVIRLKDRQD